MEAQQPTPTPPTFGRLPPGVLEDLPTLEQVPTPTPPPLFGGGNDANVPPAGGREQPLTPQTTSPGVPAEGGSGEQPPQTVAPQDDQDDNQGGGLPNIKNKENVPLDNEITEQPEDDGQEDSSEGAETAGPLT